MRNNCQNFSEGFRIWERLTEECQEVLRPHLNSKYVKTENCAHS